MKFAGRLDKFADSGEQRNGAACGLAEGFEALQRGERGVGYDILTFMPTLLEGWIIDNADVSERVLWDWRRFLSDQLSENYFSTMQAFAREHGLTYVGEATGRMQFLYDVAELRNTDVPMGEFWDPDGKGDLRVDNKAASSIAHTTGKPVVAAESYTSGGVSARWDNHPFSLKPLGDRARCSRPYMAKPKPAPTGPAYNVSSIFAARRDLRPVSKLLVQCSVLGVEEADILILLYGLQKLGWNDCRVYDGGFVNFADLKSITVYDPSLFTRRISRLKELKMVQARLVPEGRPDAAREGAAGAH